MSFGPTIASNFLLCQGVHSAAKISDFFQPSASKQPKLTSADNPSHFRYASSYILSYVIFCMTFESQYLLIYSLILSLCINTVRVVALQKIHGIIQL